jgi:hypothetical protein
MIRFLLRLLAIFSLAIAVVLGVLDATRTVAASQLVTTPLGESWQGGMPASFDATQAFVRGKLGASAWDAIAATLLQAPGFAIFLVLALLFYALGRRRARPAGLPAFGR